MSSRFFSSSGMGKYLPLGGRTHTTTLATPFRSPTIQVGSSVSALRQCSLSLLPAMLSRKSPTSGGSPSYVTLPLSLAQPVDASSVRSGLASAASALDGSLSGVIPSRGDMRIANRISSQREPEDMAALLSRVDASLGEPFRAGAILCGRQLGLPSGEDQCGSFRPGWGRAG